MAVRGPQPRLLNVVQLFPAPHLRPVEAMDQPHQLDNLSAAELSARYADISSRIYQSIPRGDQSVDEYAGHMLLRRHELVSLGPDADLPEAFWVWKFLDGLGPEFTDFCTDFHLRYSLVDSPDARQQGKQPADLELVAWLARNAEYVMKKNQHAQHSFNTHHELESANLRKRRHASVDGEHPQKRTLLG